MTTFLLLLCRLFFSISRSCPQAAHPYGWGRGLPVGTGQHPAVKAVCTDKHTLKESSDTLPATCAPILRSRPQDQARGARQLRGDTSGRSGSSSPFGPAVPRSPRSRQRGPPSPCPAAEGRREGRGKEAATWAMQEDEGGAVPARGEHHAPLQRAGRRHARSSPPPSPSLSPARPGPEEAPGWPWPCPAAAACPCRLLVAPGRQGSIPRPSGTAGLRSDSAHASQSLQPCLKGWRLYIEKK